MRRTLAALLAICYVSADEVQTDITIETPRGSLKGIHVDLGNNVSEFYRGSGDLFLGIPFVHPPINERRFKMPEPVCKYADDTYEATAYKPACPQQGSRCAASFAMSEDCLYLNVFSPDVNSKQKYPVMVYIHGGALQRGCAEDFHYRGAITNLVSRGVVVVVLQYRLGMLGFFSTKTDDFPANLGMYDQVEALRWVKDQIEYFGGDPYRITLFGQSAGSMSTSAHSYSPLSQDLFQQAILESGAAAIFIDGTFGTDTLSYKRAHKLCGTTKEAWDAQNFTGISECLANTTALEMTALDKDNILGWKVQVDGNFMPDIPHHLAAFRANMPILIGSMRDEWAFYDMKILSTGIIKFEYYSKELFNLFFEVFAQFLGDRREDVRKILMDTYAGVYTDSMDHQLWMRALSATMTSTAFTGLILREYQDQLANNNSQVYLYEMTYGNAVGTPYDLPGWDDAVWHSAELAYIWAMKQNFDDAREQGKLTDEDFELADWFGRTWTDFAKNGKPTLDDSWTPVPLTGESQYLDISGSHPTMKSNYRLTDDLIWNHVVPALTGDFYPNQNGESISIDDFNRIKSRASFGCQYNNYDNDTSSSSSTSTSITSSQTITTTMGSTSTTDSTTLITTTKAAGELFSFFLYSCVLLNLLGNI